MTHWADVCARDGVLSTLSGDLLSVSLNGGASLPFASSMPRVGSNRFGVVAIGQGRNDGDGAIMINDLGRTLKLNVIASGMQCVGVVGIGDTFRVAAVVDNGAMLYTATVTYDFGSVLDELFEPCALTSQGFLDFDGTSVVWTDTHRSKQLGAYTFVLPMRRGDFEVGQDAQDGINRIIGYDHATGKVYEVWRGYSNMPPRIALVSARVPVVAITANVSVFVPFGDWVELPSVPTAPPPPVFEDEPTYPIGTFARANHRINIHIFGASTKPYNRRTFPFLTLDSAVDDAVVVAREVELARSTDQPLFEYEDVSGDVFSLDDVKQIPHEPGKKAVLVIPMVKGYPDVTRKVFEDTVDAMCARYARVSVVFALYRQMKGEGPFMNWTMRDVVETLRVRWAYCAAIARVTDVAFFHQHRESPAGYVDGIDSRDEFVKILAMLYEMAIPLPVEDPQDEPPQPPIEEPSLPPTEMPETEPTPDPEPELEPPVVIPEPQQLEYEDDMPPVSEVVRERTIDTVTDKLRPYLLIPPADSTWEVFRKHVRNSVSVAAGRIEKFGRNAFHGEMFFQVLSERAPQPIDSGEIDTLVDWSVAQDITEGLRRR